MTTALDTALVGLIAATTARVEDGADRMEAARAVLAEAGQLPDDVLAQLALLGLAWSAAEAVEPRRPRKAAPLPNYPGDVLHEGEGVYR